MKRRSFLTLPALLPLINFRSTARPLEHRFQFEDVIGTSMDLVVCTVSSIVADVVCREVRGEIERLAAILSTRDPASEISRLERESRRQDLSLELTDVLGAYEYWEWQTAGLLSVRPEG